MEQLIIDRIRKIHLCTVEELFGFLVVVMSEGNMTMGKLPPHTLQEVGDIVSKSDTGTRIVEELKTRHYNKAKLSRKRIMDHAVGVQCTNVCNLMCSNDEIESGSTIVKNIIGGKVCGN